MKTKAQTLKIEGVVKDQETKAPLEFCSISLLNASVSAVSDEKGYFLLLVPQTLENKLIIFSLLDYEVDTLILQNGKNHYAVFLKPQKSELNEVIVTGVSKGTLIRENPVPVISISSRAIERTMETNIIDAMVKNAPGLNAVKTGPNISKPFIRGLGYNRVLTLYDGIRQEGQQWGDEHGIEVDAYNIDRAEVIKGPSSIMYGSDAMAGVISFFPAMPQSKDSVLTGKYLSEYQSNNGLIGNGIRLGLQKGHFLFSLRGSMRIAKNYKSPKDGRVYNTGFNEKNGSALLGYSAERGHIHLNATWYDNLQGIPDGSRNEENHRFTKQIMESGSDDIAARPVVGDHELNGYKLSLLKQHIQHRRVYLNSHKIVGKGDVDFLLAFQQSIRREYNHPTVPEQAGLFVRLNTLNYGVRYNFQKIAHLDLSFGVNGMLQNNRHKDATDFPIPDFNLADIGSYLFFKYKKERWTLSGGARTDFRKVSGSDFYVRKNQTTCFEKHVSIPDTLNASLQFPTLQQNFSGVSASIGSTYQITDHISLKANVARGYRAPNIAEIASNGLDPGAKIVYLGNRNFVPEFNYQEDLGLSGNFREGDFSLSIFNNHISHFIYLAQLADENGDPIVLVPGNKTFQYQQASAQIYGAEATWSLHPALLKGLNINMQASLVYGFNKSKEFDKEGIHGEYLPFIPPFKMLGTASQAILIRHFLFKEIQLKAEAEWNGAQGRYMALYGTETYTPGYLLINTGAESSINFSDRSSIKIQFQVNNLMNTSYQSNLSRLKYFGIYGMGRNACIRMIIPI